MPDSVALDVDERVVGSRVDLGGEYRVRMSEIRSDRTEPLRKGRDKTRAHADEGGQLQSTVKERESAQSRVRQTYLSRTAERVAILPQNTFIGLDINFLFVVDREPTSFEKSADVLGDLDLTRVGSSDIVAES